MRRSSIALCLPEEDRVALMAAVEAYANLGSRRDVTGRTGDGLVRFALGRELDDLAGLIGTEISPSRSSATRPGRLSYVERLGLGRGRFHVQ